jgi:hypothetical protein
MTTCCSAHNAAASPRRYHHGCSQDDDTTATQTIRHPQTGTCVTFAILEYPGGPALCVGYRTRASAVAALDRLRVTDSRHGDHVVAGTDDQTRGGD